MVHHIPQKPRILILSTSYLPLVGGSELAIKHLTDRMDSYDFDVVTGRLDDHPLREQIGRVRVFRAGGRWHRITFLVPKILLPLALAVTAWRLMRARRYVLVHAWQASQAGGAAWLLSFLTPSVPLLLTIQEGKELTRQSLLIRLFRRAIISRAVAVTAISEYLASFVRERTQVPVRVVPNGVSYERFLERPVPERMRQAHEALAVGPRHRVIVSVSRLVSKNGLDDLIEAFALLRERHERPDELVLALIGSGPQEGALRALAASLGVTEQVRFVGAIPHGDLPAYLHASDVFCRPSRSEGLGNAFLEAMAAGIPVVGTRVGGIADFLRDGETGFVCRTNDTEDIARALARALQGDEGVKKVVRQARALVQERYDWDTIATQMNEIYKEYAR